MHIVTQSHKWHQSRKGLMKVAASEIVQVEAFIIIGYYWDADELCVLSIAMNKRWVRNLAVGCEIALHKSRKCGPTWLCFKMRKQLYSSALLSMFRSVEKSADWNTVLNWHPLLWLLSDWPSWWPQDHCQTEWHEGEAHHHWARTEASEGGLYVCPAEEVK